MRDEIMDSIRRLSDDKKSKHIEPSAVLYSEVVSELHESDIKKDITELVHEDKLVWHRTLNSVSFEIK